MDFDFKLLPDILLYRSVKTREHLLGEWYSFIPEDTFGYGSITGEFKCIKPIKLLDITKNSFYNHFRDKIIYYSKINKHIDENKMILLFPLGFSDTIIYRKFANEIGMSISPQTNLTLELDTQYFGNRSRCSIMEFDLQLILVLKDIYQEYDGIVSPIKLPNILNNGYQHSEMCIFNRDNIRLIKEIPRVLQGGGNMLRPDSIKIVGAISLDNEFTRAYVSSMKEFHKTFKPMTDTNIIEQRFPSQIYEYPVENNKNTETTKNIPKTNTNKKRRTRRKNMES
jgi:hypothetical protein